ncbi:hypothetical protein ACYSNR_10780 [Enterococcus sp. LJL128]|uniref:hypothetical protein n=1 Tax=Enterococcus sp. LJL51 TaxID=3416656 RepID=UPI003CF0D903
MRFLGLTIAEIATLMAVIGSLGGWLLWICKRAYNAVKDNISDPIKQNLDGLSEAITLLSKNVEAETRWVHERHTEVVEKLGDHEEKIGHIEDTVIKHDERIKTLFRKEK